MNVSKNTYPKLSKPQFDMAKIYIINKDFDMAKSILLDMKKNNLNDNFNTIDKLLVKCQLKCGSKLASLRPKSTSRISPS